MPIYDIFDTENKEEVIEKAPSKKDRFFSSATTRLFFFLLFIADLLWGIYALSAWLICLVFGGVTWFQIPYFRNGLTTYWLSIKRSVVCGLSLFVSFFSPAFGIMIACTYFLMYDKTGIEEVVPQSLQDQFKEFLSPANSN